ncbi:methyltransferase domain-containing protein [Candidatus Micrarchaeota archaeon]|nr:methyltransferase domain-containing protein [Candidatus Micrarchaeota archaeon]
MPKSVDYLATQADLGITKHMGGLAASLKLYSMCSIKKGDYVLDVGCGIGLGPSQIAKKYGCRVVGVDISPRMIEWAKKNAEMEGASSLVEFRVADAQKLPFEDGTFDAVVCESVLSFIPDKEAALREFMRVVKKGGHICINEAAWSKEPTPEVISYFKTFGSTILAEKEWLSLFEGAGISDIAHEAFKVRVIPELIERIKLLGIRRMLNAWFLLLSQYIWKPRYFEVALEGAKASGKFMEYTGYALFAGKKK